MPQNRLRTHQHMRSLFFRRFGIVFGQPEENVSISGSEHVVSRIALNYGSSAAARQSGHRMQEGAWIWCLMRIPNKDIRLVSRAPNDISPILCEACIALTEGLPSGRDRGSSTR